MARKKIQSATDQRPFIMVYQDFLESNVLDNYYQKLVYIYLKKFADSKNQCYPSVKTISKLSGISINKVKITLNELEKKGVLVKENRSRPDGGKTSNLYRLYDFKELWNAGSSEEVAAIVDEYEEKRIIEILERKGYVVTKEKEIDTTAPTKVTAESIPELNQYNMVNTTTNSNKSQYEERYTIDQLRQIFNYDIMVEREPLYSGDIDNVMNIMYDTLNSTKKIIRVAGEDKPTMIVIGKLMKLSYESIMYAIHKFGEQTERINNPVSYMLTILYKAQEQFDLDIKNQVQHDMAHWNEYNNNQD